MPDLRGLPFGALPHRQRVPEVDVLELRPELQVLVRDVEQAPRGARGEPGIVEAEDAADVVLADEVVLALALPQVAVTLEAVLGGADELGALVLDRLPRTGREQTVDGQERVADVVQLLDDLTLRVVERRAGR